MAATNGKAEIARKYRKKYGMDMPTNKLAKIMNQDDPVRFGSIHNARMALNYIEGKGIDRKKVMDSEFYNPERRPYNPYNLPEPDDKDIEPYVLPKNWNDFIFASDFHVPAHRLIPINTMIKYANDNNIRKLLLGGDLLDNTPFTRWYREPIAPDDVPRWFDMAKNLLIMLKKHFDEIIWIEGNHDFWYTRWLVRNAELLFKDPYFRLEERLSLNEIGVKYIEQKYLIKAGKLNIHHGHLTLSGGGNYANAARMLYQKTKSSMLVGHVHVESSHTDPDIDDKIATCFSVGCMCTLRPEYKPFAGKACHGFARIKVNPDKTFKVSNFRIYKGEIL